MPKCAKETSFLPNHNGKPYDKQTSYNTASIYDFGLHNSMCSLKETLYAPFKMMYQSYAYVFAQQPKHAPLTTPLVGSCSCASKDTPKDTTSPNVDEQNDICVQNIMHNNNTNNNTNLVQNTGDDAPNQTNNNHTIDDEELEKLLKDLPENVAQYPLEDILHTLEQVPPTKPSSPVVMKDHTTTKSSTPVHTQQQQKQHMTTYYLRNRKSLCSAVSA